MSQRSETLSSDDRNKEIASIIDMVSLMKRAIESKSKELDDLRAYITSLKTRYASRLQEDVELFGRNTIK